MFQSQRGLRQGDPISPILFNLVMDNLTHLPQSQIRKKNFHTFNLGGVDSISKLHFANDSYLTTIDKEVLDKFNDFTRMRVKNIKSALVFSKSCPQELRRRLEDVIKISSREFPIKYLGIPLTSRRLGHKDCDGLIASLEKYLSRWKGMKLSYVGRLKLLN